MRASQFKLRIPETLRAKLDESCKAECRSLNSEILLRLEDSFQNEWLREELRQTRGERAATQRRCDHLTDLMIERMK